MKLWIAAAIPTSQRRRSAHGAGDWWAEGGVQETQGAAYRARPLQGEYVAREGKQQKGACDIYKGDRRGSVWYSGELNIFPSVLSLKAL